LKATSDVGLTYSKQPEKMANRLFGYVDADHAADKDDCKSVGGHVLMLNGGAICWASRKIKVVALSSFESEWYSASICGCEVQVVRRLLEEIDFTQGEPTTLFEDNMACIYASKSEKDMQSRTKHIDVRIFKLREFVETGVLNLVKVESEFQVADNFTKPLPRIGVEFSRDITSGKTSIKEGMIYHM
jgi:hypothetical protein